MMGRIYTVGYGVLMFFKQGMAILFCSIGVLRFLQFSKYGIFDF